MNLLKVQKVHGTYIETMRSNALKKSTNAKYVIKPKKYQCGVCITFKNASEADEEHLKNEYVHLSET